MDIQDLKQKILKEQDFICEFARDSDSILDNKYIKEDNISFDDVIKIIVSDDDILNSLKFNNLVKVLTNLKVKENTNNKNKIRNMISDRMDKEPFYVEDMDNSFFLISKHGYGVISNALGEDIVNKLVNKVDKEINDLKGTDYERISSKLTKYYDKANFLKYKNDGVFSKEKMDMMEKMFSNNTHALEYINFGLFKDEIYNNFSNEFIEYISKFPKLSNKFVILSQENPKLFSIIQNRVKTYDNLIDNYGEIEIMIDGFYRNGYEIDIKNTDEKTCENLINWLGNKKRIEKFITFNNYKDIPLDYSDDYLKKLNEYWDGKFSELSSNKITSIDKLNLETERKKELENLIKNETDRDKKLNYELEKIDVDYNIESLKNDLKEIDDKKIDVFFNRKFSMSYKEAKKMLKEYGSDLDNIDGIQKEKRFFNELRYMLNNVDKVDLFYDKNSGEYDYITLDKIKHTISKECAKSYVSNLSSTKEKIDKIIERKDPDLYKQIEVDGQMVEVIKINGSFDMLVHSTSSGFIVNKKIEENHDFKEEWENSDIKTDHIVSSTYINQDFLGIPPVDDNGVIYGNVNVPRENIQITGVTDINTFSRSYAFDAETRQYMTAKTQPNSCRRVYGEVANEKQKPDFVILTDDASSKVKENTFKAAKQFGIPVAYIDKKEIVKTQVNELNTLMDNFEKTNNTDILKVLINKYETNVSGWLLNRKPIEDESHTGQIDNSRFSNDFDKVENRMQNVISDYLDKIELSNIDMSKEVLSIATTILQERQLYEDSLSGGSEKKISPTQMKFNTENIILRINNILDKNGMTDYKIKNDTKYEDYIKMKEVAKNAICRQRVSSDDIEKALNIEEKEMEDKSIC